jgi:hypothetical protein
MEAQQGEILRTLQTLEATVRASLPPPPCAEPAEAASVQPPPAAPEAPAPSAPAPPPLPAVKAARAKDPYHPSLRLAATVLLSAGTVALGVNMALEGSTDEARPRPSQFPAPQAPSADAGVVRAPVPSVRPAAPAPVATPPVGRTSVPPSRRLAPHNDLGLTIATIRRAFPETIPPPAPRR